MTSMSPFLSRLAGRIAMILAAGLLAACSVDVDQGGGGGYGPRPSQYCGLNSPPVCGARGDDLQTFANSCEARDTGYRVIGEGECRRPRPRPDEGGICTREYAPVCGARGRDRQTFANACEARSSGFDVIGGGECQVRRPDRDLTDGRDRDRDDERPGWRDGDDDRGGRDRDRRGRDRRDREPEGRERQDRDRQDRERTADQRVCTMEYNPVCGQRGRDLKTFGNACSAQAAGFSIRNPGECAAQ